MAYPKYKIKFVSWFNSLFPGKYCWASCVAWAFSKSLNPFNIDRATSCKEESKEHECKACYCGSWQNGKCWDLLTKKEQEQEKINQEQIASEIPF